MPWLFPEKLSHTTEAQFSERLKLLVLFLSFFLSLHVAMVIADCNCILTALSAAGGRGHECKIYKNMKRLNIYLNWLLSFQLKKHTEQIIKLYIYSFHLHYIKLHVVNIR